MGRPKGGTNNSHSKEEKLALVLRNLAGETARSLEREKFYAEKPMQKIVTDVTYIKPIRKLNRKPPVQYRLEQAA